MDNLHPIFRSLSFRQVAYVLAAAEEGNVTAAARKLNVSQPAISAAISALEQHFDLKIFVRQPGLGVELTSFGAEVVREARKLREEAYRFAMLAHPAAELTGDVTLSCYNVLAPYILPQLMSGLARALPEVRLKCLEADLEGVTHHLRRGTADLGISYDLGLENDLEIETLYYLQPQLICGADSPFAGRASVHLRELDRQNLILLDQSLSALFVLGLLKAHKADPVVAARVTGFELQRALVANGFGVAITYTQPRVDQAYDGKELHCIRIADELIPQRVVLVSPRLDHQRPLLAAMRRQIVAHFEGGPVREGSG